MKSKSNEPTIEKSIETRFFKKHAKHMPALINIKKKTETQDEIVKDLVTKE